MDYRLKADEHYALNMEEQVRPYLEERMTDGYLESVPGQRLYYRHFRADHPYAVLVMMHGFTESVEKFDEVVWAFLRQGLEVWQLQQREHGRSYRSTDDPALVYIEDYRQLIRDLHEFVEKKVKTDPTSDRLPRYLFGHSMGGGVAACYIEEYPEDFSRAVLSSPMLELNSGGIPVWAAELFAKVMILIGRGKAYMPGAVPFSGKPDFENSCGNSPERYQYWFAQVKKDPKKQMCVTAVRTALEFLRLTRHAVSPDHCRRIKCNVLLFQAGLDTMVQPGGQDTFIRQLGDKGRLVRIPEAKHEIYLCTDDILDKYWPELLKFLG